MRAATHPLLLQRGVLGLQLRMAGRQLQMQRLELWWSREQGSDAAA
jgi:hypothetical protein